MSSAIRAALVGLLAAIAVVVVPLATGGPAQARDPAITVPPGASLTLTGHGFGHGHGLSQYGAQGAALQGLTADQIVQFYYPGTTLGRITGQVRVLLSADTSPDVLVLTRSGLMAQQVGSSTTWDLPALHPRADRWRIRAKGATRDELDWRGPDRQWHPQATVTGHLQFVAGGQPITLVLPDRSQHAYRGALRAVPPSAGSTRRVTVNSVGLQNYLRGVVPREMPASWSPAAVQAQAIAARTYAAFALAEHHTGYDICDSTSCQVYGGFDAEQPASNAAVVATSGVVVLAGGAPAFTQFSSSDGGWTTDGGKPYLPAQADPYDAWSGNPNHTWTVTMTAAALAKHWPSIGALSTITVTARDGHGAEGGRVLSLTLTGSKASVALTGDAFRNALGLRSTWVDFAVN